MNNVQLVGRLTRDPEIKYSTGENPVCVARYTVACDRRLKRDNEPTADFISCVSFGKAGEVLEKYFHKGMKIGIVGRIQTGSYTNKDGNKVYTTDVVTESVEFVESKNNSINNNQPSEVPDGFTNIPEGIDDEIPFN